MCCCGFRGGTTGSRSILPCRYLKFVLQWHCAKKCVKRCRWFFFMVESTSAVMETMLSFHFVKEDADTLPVQMKLTPCSIECFGICRGTLQNCFRLQICPLKTHPRGLCFELLLRWTFEHRQNTDSLQRDETRSKLQPMSPLATIFFLLLPDEACHWHKVAWRHSLWSQILEFWG